jgi:hypothetical protein
MANLVYVNEGTPIVWADIGGDFGDSPIAGTVQITLASLASAGARQGVKVDLGDPRAEVYEVTLRLEWDVAPADGTTASLYFAPSPHATAGTANPGGVSGTDAAYTGTAGSTIAESLQQCDLVCILPCTNDAAPVVQQVTSRYRPPARYVSPIVLNEGGQALEGDDVEMSITMIPLPFEIQ